MLLEIAKAAAGLLKTIAKQQKQKICLRQVGWQVGAGLDGQQIIHVVIVIFSLHRTVP